MLRSQDIQFFVFKPFSTNVPLLYPLKHQKTSVFLMFSGGIEVKHCLKMGYPANIRLDEDVLKTSFAFVFKTSWSRRTYSLYLYVFRRRLQDVLIKTSIFVLVICLQNIFKMASRRLGKTSSRHLQDVFKTFSRRLKDVLPVRLQDIFKTPLRRFEDDFKTSSRRLTKMSSRRFHDVLSSYTVLVNKFSRCLQDVFTTFLRCTSKTVIYRRICLGHTSEKFMISVQNLQGWQQFLKF